MLKKLFCRKEEGITLLEVIIATFILEVAIIGSYLTFVQISKATSSVSDRFVAVYIAQEGIEVIRNIRDTNWLSNPTDLTKWNISLSGCASGCEVDYEIGTNSPITLLPTYSGEPLRIDNKGFYTYDMTDGMGDTTATKFKRRITITTIPGSDKLDVVADVIWDDRGQPYSLEVEEYLYNWK